MKKLLLPILALLFCSATIAKEKTVEEYTAEAPFKMPTVVVPAFPDNELNVLDFGAVPDGRFLNTEAFSKTIAACVAKGGGKVVVPAGLWLTGPIEMKSNVNLHVERGALILFSRSAKDFVGADGKLRFPISGEKLKNIAITGGGIIDGSGEVWRPVKKMKTTDNQWKSLLKQGGVLTDRESIWWPTEEQSKKDSRPNLVNFKNCENVLVEDITLRSSPKFVLYPNSCSHVTIRNVNVYNEWWAQNGDGIDISACKNVVVYKCNVSVGDDGICMKSSGDNNKPNLENVLIAACNVYHAHGGFVIGSNTNGDMNNIYVVDCNFVGSDIGVRVKSNGGRGGEVKNVYIKNIFMANIVEEAFHFDTYYQNVPAGATRVEESALPTDKIPELHHFYISNIRCNGAKAAVAITGLPNHPVRHIFFDDVIILAKEGVTLKNAEDIYFKNTKIITEKEAAPVLENTKNINLPE
ncbi:MAG: glycoside hydrolase family 28 protein [Prevotellaceae bacterium]|jgi:DNA sulfur modification protein DndE|nr:glycoside hydrolase family 28 protein [Prevotellaceae bacterium]